MFSARSVEVGATGPGASRRDEGAFTASCKKVMEDSSAQALEHNSKADLLKTKSPEHFQTVSSLVKVFIDSALAVSSLQLNVPRKSRSYGEPCSLAMSPSSVSNPSSSLVCSPKTHGSHGCSQTREHFPWVTHPRHTGLIAVLRHGRGGQQF